MARKEQGPRPIHDESPYFRLFISREDFERTFPVGAARRQSRLDPKRGKKNRHGFRRTVH